jgi:hypothetical protein
VELTTVQHQGRLLQVLIRLSSGTRKTAVDGQVTILSGSTTFSLVERADRRTQERARARRKAQLPTTMATRMSQLTMATATRKTREIGTTTTTPTTPSSQLVTTTLRTTATTSLRRTTRGMTHTTPGHTPLGTRPTSSVAEQS